MRKILLHASNNSISNFLILKVKVLFMQESWIDSWESNHLRPIFSMYLQVV